MQIVGNPAADLQPGTFSESIENGKLSLPEQLVRMLERSNVATAEDFVSHLRCFPRALVRELRGWTDQDVDQASQALLKHLDGLVDDQILKPAPAPKRSFGARRI